MNPIAILDRVTLPSEDARPWVQRLHDEYVPGAIARGLHLRGTWSSSVDADAVEVCVLWELDDVGAFWRMRAAARADPSVDEWWSATDAVAIARVRRVYESVEP